jgi:hypothetical protein
VYDVPTGERPATMFRIGLALWFGVLLTLTPQPQAPSWLRRAG